MGNLLSALTTTASSMDVLQRALSVVSNNVTNAKTPGYAKQDLNLIARNLDLTRGLTGGLDAGPLLNSRATFLETAVFQQTQRLGNLAQQSQSLRTVEANFDIGQQSGIAASVDRLFQIFSAWSVSPNDQPVRESVLRSAGEVSGAFQNASASLGNAAGQADVELRGAVAAVNRIGAQLQKLNVTLREDARNRQDPGVESQIFSLLEELSEYVDFTVLRGAEGSYGVYAGGQTPLTIGDKFFPLEADFSGVVPVIRDQNGTDITAQIQQGRIRGLIDFRADFLPGVSGDLDRLAETLADRVNELLLSGVDKNGQVPTTNLFVYDAAAGAAATLAVTGIRPDELAGALPEYPGGNGNALNLAALGTSREVDDFTFAQFYGYIAGNVGRAVSNAEDDERTQTLLLSQAKTMRSEATAVSLDEEAAKLIEFQRAYEASAELVRILNSLTETLMNILR